jgi:hypothetical protein
MALQHLRSATANKRPDPAAMADGQLAVNTAATSPGVFFKDAAGNLVKAGPVHVGTSAPNVSPASGGHAGNSTGELWLDTTGTDYTLKTWDGSAWREIVVTSTMIKDGTIVNADINASAAIVDTKLATIATAGKVSNSATTAASANTTNAIVARDASGNFSAGTITANLTGTASAIADNTVTSAKIVDGTIVNADVNASAAIAGTKISPDFGSQTIATTGVFSHALGAAATPSVTFTGDLNTGIYSPGADQVAISTNGTGRLFVDASGQILVGAPTSVNVGAAAGSLGQYFKANENNIISLTVGINSAAGPKLNISKSRSTVYGNYISAQANDQLGRIVFCGDDGTSLEARAAEIGAFVESTPSTGVMPGRLVFSTTPSASGTPTERMRLDSSGRLGLGTSAPYQELTLRGTNEQLLFDLNTTTNGVYGSLAWNGSTSDQGTGNYSAEIRGYREAAGAYGALGFHTRGASGASVERVRIDSSGRVGIGTTSPGVALHVDGDIRCDGVYGETDTNTSIQFPGSDVITFNEGGSEAARIDSSGRLLVGTSTARQIGTERGLQVESTGPSGSLSIARNDNSSAGASPVVVLGRSRGTTNGSNTVVQADDDLGYLIFAGADGSSMNSYGAWIRAQVDGTPGADDMPGRLVFSTTADGAATPTERLRITSAGVLQVADAGNITVGTTTGTKIGTATTQKIGFYNATPVVQPAAVADATTAVDVITQLNDLLAKLRTLGIIAT